MIVPPEGARIGDYDHPLQPEFKMSKTMKAVIFDGPNKVSVQQRPIPTLQAEMDIIVEVSYTALCGS